MTVRDAVVVARRAEEADLFLLGCALREQVGIGGHRGPDELLEGGGVDRLPLAEVDRAPRVAFEAGVEEAAAPSAGFAFGVAFMARWIA
jgi:hypothetical protein